MNEVAMTARRWRTMLAEHPDVIVVANADDPMVEFAASQSPTVIWVGAGQVWTSDSSVCAACGSLLARGDDTWSCPGCGRRRPDPQWQLVDGVATGPDGTRYDLSGLQLPGRFNQANATLAGRRQRGRSRGARSDGTGGLGIRRYGAFDVGALRIPLPPRKNPAGWAELLDATPPPPHPSS
jgi:hypothetical protein